MEYLRHRLARIPGTPYAIAAGFASGAAVSFTPFVGFHFIIAAFVAWLIRGNIFTSALGTIVGNPWTFPVIWLTTYQTGTWLLGWDMNEELPLMMHNLLNSFTLGDLMFRPMETIGPFVKIVILPILIGSMLWAPFIWFITYWPIYNLVDRYKKARSQKTRPKKDIENSSKIS